MSEYYSVSQLLANSYFNDRRFEWSGGNPVYIGLHRKANANTADREWQIYRLSWSGSDITRMQGPITGSWDDRAILGW